MDSQNNAPKFAFLYMLSLVALVFTALSAGMIIFQIINKTIPDVLNEFRGRYSLSQLKFAISALFVAAPIFYFTTRQIHKSLFDGALAAGSNIRRWLTYFILFIASVVMLGWLIATVNSFLDGELTTKFILKAITAIGIAAGIFTFYFYDIRRKQVVGQADKIIRLYGYGSLIIVIAVFAASLFFVESPQETRNRKLDSVILNKFSTIDSAINVYYRDYNKLPQNLDDLEKDVVFISDDDLADPASGKKFDYKITAKDRYELCATFRASNISQETGNHSKDIWPHKSGYQCLSQKIHKNDYPEARPLETPPPR